MEDVQKLKAIFEDLRYHGAVKTQKDFAALLGYDHTTISKAMQGNRSALTPSLLSKAVALSMNIDSTQNSDAGTLLVLPAEARGGTIADFIDAIHEYDCERMVSPVKGADYAMQVIGDSMAPEYPSGSRVLIKKVNEELFIEWGKVYVLDTDNGALIKQIRKTDRPDFVECVSLNPDYDSFEINTQYIHGWYRVLMVLALK